MTALDRRHRWGPAIRDGARITRVCSACGRSVTFETIVPDTLVDELLRAVTAPNPYRTAVVA